MAEGGMMFNQDNNHEWVIKNIPWWMVLIVFVLMLLVPSLLFPHNAQAQQGLSPMYYLCNGQWYAGSCGGYQQTPSVGQPFVANVDGRQMQMVCSWEDRLVSGLSGAASGWVVGYIANHSTTNTLGQNVKVVNQAVPVIAGMLAGATVMCRPTSGKFIKDFIDGDEQPVQQQQASQPSTTRQSSGGSRTVDMCKNNRTGEIVGPADNGPDRCGRYRNVGNQQSEQSQPRVLATYTGLTTYRNLSTQECNDKKGEYLGGGRCLAQ